MKILVLEYVTGGGLRREPLPPSLAKEGGRMRQALVEDLLAVPGVELLVCNDDRLPASSLGPRVQMADVAAGQPFQAAWRQGIEWCDAVWPVAPETAGILERLCLEVEAAGKALLTSTAAAVRLAASKLETVRRLERCGLKAVPTVPLSAWKIQDGQAFVVKPDDGVGCEGSRVFHGPARPVMPADAENWIAQPLLQGEPLSLSALFAQGQARLLGCNRQVVEMAEGGFVLKACQVNAVADADGRWQALAGRIAQAVPELWGYAGVDLVLTAGGPVILEINPRLTTSYAGLRPATGENPAALTLELLKTGLLPPPRRGAGKAVEINLE